MLARRHRQMVGLAGDLLKPAAQLWVASEIKTALFSNVGISLETNVGQS